MNREREINRVFVISVVIASVLVISLIGVMIARSSNRAREKSFAEDLSSFDTSKLDSESASTQIGKSVDESEEDEFEEAEVTQNITDSTNTTTETSSETEKNMATNKINTDINIENKIEKNTTIETNSKSEKKDEKIEFEPPVKGEILREFAKESLVFSNTLQEWITHTGIDIKADKTTVVKAAANGTVSAIKNDPRYGLTIIINHDNGYQTIYSNLLTAEFVVKGEKVEKGQSIGTVGNSATFEVEDDYHLHLELLKDNQYLDPVIYMSF